MNKLTKELRAGIFQNALDIILITGDLTFGDVGFIATEYSVRFEDTCLFLERIGLVQKGRTEAILQRASGAYYKQQGKAKYENLGVD